MVNFSARYLCIWRNFADIFFYIFFLLLKTRVSEKDCPDLFSGFCFFAGIFYQPAKSPLLQAVQETKGFAWISNT
jgi:hypothetical protein